MLKENHLPVVELSKKIDRRYFVAPIKNGSCNPKLRLTVTFKPVLEESPVIVRPSSGIRFPLRRNGYFFRSSEEGRVVAEGRVLQGGPREKG